MRLTTTRLLVAGFTLTIVAVVGSLIVLHERERPEDLKAPTGPSSVIRGIRKRAAERADAERRNQALGIEQALQHDAGSERARRASDQQ